jgi:hypothetical protein
MKEKSILLRNLKANIGDLSKFLEAIAAWNLLYDYKIECKLLTVSTAGQFVFVFLTDNLDKPEVKVETDNFADFVVDGVFVPERIVGDNFDVVIECLTEYPDTIGSSIETIVNNMEICLECGEPTDEGPNDGGCDCWVGCGDE